MRIIIELYIFTCIMLVIFNIGFLVVKRIKGLKFYGKDDTFTQLIMTEYKRYNKDIRLRREFKRNIRAKIPHIKYLITLQNTLESIQDCNPYFLIDIRCLVCEQIEVYRKKSDYEQAYYTYVISCFDYSIERLEVNYEQKFISFLESKSLYTFTNTMNAIYKFGDPYMLSIAIRKIDERNGFYHKKLFVDGLLSFKGDINIVHQLMIDEFYTYTSMTQESLLDYFRLKGVEISEFCLGILGNAKIDYQVLYSAMRYFMKYPNNKARIFFMDVLKHEHEVWVKEMLAIQGLKSFDDRDTRDIMKTKITSSNWYIRSNAISYLHDHDISREEIFTIVALKDRYANEALLYQYKDDKEMQRYIMHIITILNSQQEAEIA